MLQEWYGIIPNKVLYDPEMKAQEKLLFCSISSLCAEKWYCRANNEFFSQRFGITKSHISRWINKLKDKWYIEINIDESQGNKRKICLVENNKRVLSKTTRGIVENDKRGLVENDKHNNTIYNIINKKNIPTFVLESIKWFFDEKMNNQSDLRVRRLIEKMWKDQFYLSQLEELERLHRLDGYEREQIVYVMKWILQSDFRSQNVYSFANIRSAKKWSVSKFDKIAEQAKNDMVKFTSVSYM